MVAWPIVPATREDEAREWLEPMSSSHNGQQNKQKTNIRLYKHREEAGCGFLPLVDS
jgi:hypothetical protein